MIDNVPSDALPLDVLEDAIVRVGREPRPKKKSRYRNRRDEKSGIVYGIGEATHYRFTDPLGKTHWIPRGIDMSNRDNEPVPF
jgi:hypothetical protein